MISKKQFTKYYPDQRRNGTLAFYNWVRDNINCDMLLLNLGAGPATHNPLRILRGQVARVVGADVDPIVLKNDELDEAHVIENGILPFDENCFDIVLSDYVLEHVEHPRLFIDGVYRVLKPNGIFFFRTPNKYHYVSLVARLTPPWFHDLVANRVRGLKEDAHEPYLTFHRLNSKATINELARQAGFRDIELRFFEADPSYLVFHAIPFLIGVGYERLVNSSDIFAQIRANIFGKLTK